MDPFDWNVVIAGRWNRAILTPKGVARFVYALEEDQNLRIEVPVDGLSPYRVFHPDGDIFVSHDPFRLLINLKTPGYRALGKAMRAGATALERLPVTPVTAAGFNVKFRTTEPLDLDHLGSTGADDRLSDGGFAMRARTFGRVLAFGDGELNVAIMTDDDETVLHCNFHRGSEDKPDLIAWLSMEPDDVRRTVRNLCESLSLPAEEPSDDAAA